MEEVQSTGGQFVEMVLLSPDGRTLEPLIDGNKATCNQYSGDGRRVGYILTSPPIISATIRKELEKEQTRLTSTRRPTPTSSDGQGSDDRSKLHQYSDDDSCRTDRAILSLPNSSREATKSLLSHPTSPMHKNKSLSKGTHRAVDKNMSATSPSEAKQQQQQQQQRQRAGTKRAVQAKEPPPSMDLSKQRRKG